MNTAPKKVRWLEEAERIGKTANERPEFAKWQMEALLDRRRAAYAQLPEGYALDLTSPALVGRVRRKQAITESCAALPYPGIVWLGPSGSGKSTLACATARAWIDTRVRTENDRPPAILFALAQDIAVASRYHKLGKGRPELITSAIRAELLILDELGDKFENGQWDDLSKVVFTRYQRARPTWLTTWLPARTREPGGKSVANIYGDGFARRLFERSAVINCGG